MDLILEALRSQYPIGDEEFDSLFPSRYRKLSETHWTSVEIARRAAELLVTNSNTRVLDVGSGVGKFCMIGALSTPGQFVGIEQRPHLVKFSQRLVRNLEIPRVTFLLGDARNVNWSEFQSFYLYNPFIENLYATEAMIDQTMGSGEVQYKTLVKWVQHRLHALPVGTKVATYHGFGGDMPPGYQLTVEEEGGGDFLRLWIKTDPTPPKEP